MNLHIRMTCIVTMTVMCIWHDNNYILYDMHSQTIQVPDAYTHVLVYASDCWSGLKFIAKSVLDRHWSLKACQ